MKFFLIHFKKWVLANMMVAITTFAFLTFLIYQFNISHVKDECNAKIAVVGHLYSIVVRFLVDKDGNTTRYEFPDLLNKLAEDLNKERIDALVLTGDITQYGTQEEWDLVNDFISKLKSKVYMSPGNHDVGATKRKEVYLKNVGYTSKKVNINGCNLVMLNSVNENQADSNSLQSGFGPDANSLKILKNLDKNKVNLLFMHQSIYSADVWKKDTLGLFYIEKPNDIHHHISTPNAILQEKKWLQNIQPIIKNKVEAVYSGDYHSKRISMIARDGIQYVANGFRFIEDSVIGNSGKGPLTYTMVYAKNTEIINYVRYLLLDNAKIYDY